MITSEILFVAVVSNLKLKDLSLRSDFLMTLSINIVMICVIITSIYEGDSLPTDD